MMLRGCLVLCLCACSDAPTESAAPVDPFTGESEVLVLEHPSRAFAVLPDGRFVLALELSDELLVVRAEGESLVAGDPLAAGDGPRDAVGLDVNADGLVDLVSADTSGATLSVLLGSDVGFGAAAMLAATAPTRLATLDADGDGWTDLLVSAGLGMESRIELWRNAAGVLEPMPMSVPLANSDRCRTGDLDGDGAADAVVTLSSEGQVALLTASAGLPALHAVLDVCDGPLAGRIGDLDGSGAGDVAIACKGELFVLLDPMKGSERSSLQGGGQLYDVAMADFDGDGTLDLAAVDVTEHALRLWLSPLSHRAAPAVHPVARGPIALEPVDMEGDGDVDLAILAYEQRSLQVLLNQRR
jgi:hypothetical protein